MIKKIHARNFLSLKEVDLELGVRNVLVGPNMSGKSNLVDLLRFLATIASARPGLHSAILQRGGFEELCWKGGAENLVEIGVTVELPSAKVSAKPTVYEYSLSLLGAEGMGFAVDREKLVILVRNKEPRVIYEIEAGSAGTVEENSKLRKIELGTWTTALEAVGLPNTEADRFRSFLASWRFFHLIPPLMRKENPANPQRFLQEHGENLSSWITTLQTKPEAFLQIRQAISDALPELADVFIQPTQASTIVLGTREKHLRRPTSIYRMSDGELAFLALVSLIFAPPELSAPVFCLEEPENYLHPYLLEMLVELLTQRQDDLGDHAAQIVATTHSPQLVGKMSIDDLIVVEKTEGRTQFTRPSTDRQLRKLVASKEHGLGDLWYTGALRGI
jgi:predicted ATPase